MRERRVDLAGLPRDPVRARSFERLERAHVVEAIRELDQDDAQVPRHREEHLAEVLGLLPLGAVEVEAADLGDAVHESRDLPTERALDVFEADLRVLDHVVEHRRLNERLVCAGPEEIGQDRSDGQAMGHIRLAREADLGPVGFDGEVVRRADRVRVDGAAGPLERVEERSQGISGDRSHGYRI